MEKTISNLNSKMWYRALKIIYLFVIIILLLVSFGISYNRNLPASEVLDRENSVITCNYGNKEKFTINKSGIYFSDSEFSKYNPTTYYHGDEVQELCGITEIDLNNILSNTNENKIEIYNINPVMKLEGGVIPFLGHLVLSSLIILFIFEILRRVFYYIVLGTIKPKK